MSLSQTNTQRLLCPLCYQCSLATTLNTVSVVSVFLGLLHFCFLSSGADFRFSVGVHNQTKPDTSFNERRHLRNMQSCVVDNSDEQSSCTFSAILQAEVQVVEDMIDCTLLDMANSGYAYPVSSSEVARTLQHIREMGELPAVPRDGQASLIIKCSVPVVTEEKSAVARLTQAWDKLEDLRYEFEQSHGRIQ